MRTATMAAMAMAGLLGAAFAGTAQTTDDLVFVHHSVGEGWLADGLRDALDAKGYVDEVNESNYGTDFDPDAGRPDSLGLPGDSTDMCHWIFWFNDYIGGLKTLGCQDGRNRIVMFKSCFPNSDLDSDGTEPGDPFACERTLANYRAIYRHPAGPGGVYTNWDNAVYQPLGGVFAANPDTLFVVVTPPPQCNADQPNDANARRARTFGHWLKNEWLPSYNAEHPGLNNVAVFDLFDVLANSDAAASHPNRLKVAYGGNSGDSHPNSAGNQELTRVFAETSSSFIDRAWDPFAAGQALDLWTGATVLGGGWKRVSWFGTFWDSGNDWIWHTEHGWMYCLADAPESIWFWTPDLGWLWSGSGTYSILWRASDGAWLWYVRDTAPRQFYNFATTSWEQH